MSSDMMLVCRKRGEHFDGDKHAACLFVTEASAGEPWTEFGKMLAANMPHRVTDEFIERALHWASVLEGMSDPGAADNLRDWLLARRDAEIDIELW